MNILTHAVHTGYQFDLGLTGHEFYSLTIPGSQEVFWDHKSRPLPPNFHQLRFDEEPPVKFDLALAHFGLGFDCLKRSRLPMIYKEHCLQDPFTVPQEWLQRISFYSFASNAAAIGWRVPEEYERRKVIIGMGMDLKSYPDHEARKAPILAVGQNISSRGNEKGLDNLLFLSAKFPITIVGCGNEGIPGAVGQASSYEMLLKYYQQHSVFLNPSNSLGMSTLEAMAAGIAVVTFRMTNSDVIKNGHNGFVVETLEQAEKALCLLLEDYQLARKLGQNARHTIENRYKMDIFIYRWNQLFQRTVTENQMDANFCPPGLFDLNSKTDEDRQLIRSISNGIFDYCRIGHDHRRMTFLPNGRIGEGATSCELFWDVKSENGETFLEIYAGAWLTCRLKLGIDGIWKGHWTRYEKMPVILSLMR